MILVNTVKLNHKTATAKRYYLKHWLCFSLGKRILVKKIKFGGPGGHDLITGELLLHKMFVLVNFSAYFSNAGSNCNKIEIIWDLRSSLWLHEILKLV
jgi:hypothetical protein